MTDGVHETIVVVPSQLAEGRQTATCSLTRPSFVPAFWTPFRRETKIRDVIPDLGLFRPHKLGLTCANGLGTKINDVKK